MQKLILSSFLILTGFMAQSTDLQSSLQKVLDKSIDGKKVFGTSFAIKKDSLEWYGAAGDFSIDQSFFIASTTKLFTTAIILHLKSKGKLSLDDKISKHLDEKTLTKLHVYKGKDYSNELTILHLLAHTSGLPDYFQDKGANKKSLEDELVSGNDQSWTIEQAFEWTKEMNPIFVPGAEKKAHYSDANFQLLGKIIENITGKSYAENCNEIIINPLGMSKTYLYQNPNDKTPKSMYYKSQVLEIPKAMTSFGADGGMVSTTADMLVFIQAFFEGKFFPKVYIKDLQAWNKIFFPMKSGIGIHLFKLPKISNPTGLIPYFIGHSGLSGALAFYSPQEDFYIVGTTNQIAHPDLSFRTMIKLTQVLLKGG